MENERQGLLNAIIARPADDIPRLVYADWLEDHSEPQSEFIRIQCELAKRARWDSDYASLLLASEAFKQRHEKKWRADVGIKCRSYFNRGFLTWITLSAKALSELDPAVFAKTPISSVQVTHINDAKLQLLAKSGMMKHVRGLRLSPTTSTSHAISLIELVSPRLQRLDFSGHHTEISADLALAMANSKVAGRLKELFMRACSIPESFFAALAKHGGLPKLQHFEFGGGFSIARPAHFEGLNLSRVRRFRIGGKMAGSDVQQLCFLPLNKLTSLSLRGTRPPAKGIQLLAEAGAFTNTERINLETCNLSKKSLVVLLQTGARKCTRLNLKSNANVDLDFVHQLAASKLFPSLRELNVTDTSVDDPDDGMFYEELPFRVNRNL